MNTTTVVSVLVVVIALAAAVQGADCPRFRGPAGDGVFPETGLLKKWPEGGPKVAWTAKGLGQGYSSATVANGIVYVTGMDEQKQGYLFAFGLGWVAEVEGGVWGGVGQAWSGRGGHARHADY